MEKLPCGIYNNRRHCLYLDQNIKDIETGGFFMPLYEFEGKRPSIDKTSYIHPQAVLIGEIEIGELCFVGAGAVIRGDYGKIIIGSGTAVEENCTIHAEPKSITIIEENVIVGHGAIIHGPCLIKNNVVIGMGAIVCPRCEIGANSILGAGSVLPQGRNIPERKIAFGNPAIVIRNMEEKDLQYNKFASDIYRNLTTRYTNNLKLIKE